MVQVYRLAHPVSVENTPAYAGCKSWVPLEESVATAGAQAGISDADYESRRQKILCSVMI